MKKAQVLSAIALAFALGLTVVAPVANVSAFTVEDVEKDVKGSATEAEVAAAVAAVKANYPMYNNVINLNSVIEAVNKNTNKFDLQANSDKASLASAIMTALTDADAPFGYTGDADKTVWTPADGVYTAQIAKAVAQAEGVKNYSVFEQLTAALDPETGSDTAFRAAIKAFNGAYKTNINYSSSVTVKKDAATVKTAMETAMNTAASGAASNGAANYEAYMDLVADVNTAEEASANYTKYLGELSDALKANGILNQTQLEGLLSALKGKNVSIDTLVSTYVTGAANVQTLITDWGAVQTAVENAEKGAINLAGATNYNLVLSIAGALETAVPVLEKTTEEIAQELVGYVAPETPDDNTTTTIESADGSVSVKGELQAGLVVEAKEAEEKDEMFKKAFGDKKFFVYDIKIKGQNGYVTTFDKDVTVTVKVPEGIDGAKAGIYYVNAEGSASKIASTYNAEAKTLTFTTNHFSYYAIVEDNGVNVSDSGVLAAADGTASSTVAIVAGIATALTAAGAGVVAYRNARRAGKEA